MGVGFIVTIILLAILLGVFSRQVLTSSVDTSQPEDGSDSDDHHDDHHKDKPHFHAM